MSKVRKLFRPNGEFGGYWIWCSGCKYGHVFDNRWTFNGDFDNPTFSPSMLVNKDEPNRRCHSFVTDGKIQYLDDCFHEYKGQTLNLEDLENVDY